MSPALRWIRDNPDVAALVLETGAQNQSCASFVEHLRGLGLTTPVIIVAPERAGAPLAELKAGADDYIVNNQSLLAELPLVLTRALERTEAAAVATKAPMRLLYVGDAALARRCVEHLQKSIEITAVVPESSGAFPALPLSFDIVLVEYGHPGVDAFAILKDVAHRRPQVPVILVVEWDEKLAIPAFKLGAVDYVVKAADSFRALFFKLDRAPAISPPHEGHADLLEADADQKAAEAAARERLERELGDALATARDTERSLNTATEHFRESEARLQATIDRSAPSGKRWKRDWPRRRRRARKRSGSAPSRQVPAPHNCSSVRGRTPHAGLRSKSGSRNSNPHSSTPTGGASWRRTSRNDSRRKWPRERRSSRTWRAPKRRARIWSTVFGRS